MKLVSPKNFDYFMYCVLVTVDLPLQKDEVKCLNIIQDNRGKTVPGYLTLFQRCSSLSSLKYSRQDSLTSFERLVDDIDDDETSNKNGRRNNKRSRTVSTI